MTKRPFLHKWFINGEWEVRSVDIQEETHDRARDEDGARVVCLDCDEEGVTIDQNDPYLD